METDAFNQYANAAKQQADSKFNAGFNNYVNNAQQLAQQIAYNSGNAYGNAPANNGLMSATPQQIAAYVASLKQPGVSSIAKGGLADRGISHVNKPQGDNGAFWSNYQQGGFNTLPGNTANAPSQGQPAPPPQAPPPRTATMGDQRNTTSPLVSHQLNTQQQAQGLMSVIGGGPGAQQPQINAPQQPQQQAQSALGISDSPGLAQSNAKQLATQLYQTMGGFTRR